MFVDALGFWAKACKVLVIVSSHVFSVILVMLPVAVATFPHFMFDHEILQCQNNPHFIDTMTESVITFHRVLLYCTW